MPGCFRPSALSIRLSGSTILQLTLIVTLLSFFCSTIGVVGVKQDIKPKVEIDFINKIVHAPRRNSLETVKKSGRRDEHVLVFHILSRWEASYRLG